MAPALTDLVQSIITANARWRGSGEAHPGDGIAAAAAAQARRWGIQRALVADDPVLHGLGVPGGLADAGVEILTWPDGRGRGGCSSRTWDNLLSGGTRRNPLCPVPSAP